MVDTIDVIFNSLTSIMDILKWTWWLFLLVGLIILKVRWKNYPLEAVILEKRGDNLIKTNDRLGKFQDPFTKLVNYRLLKAKDSIPVIHFNWIMVNAVKPTNIFETIISKLRPDVGTVFLFKYGTKQYKPINIKEKEGNKIVYQEIKNEKGESVTIQVYQQFDARHYVGALEFDVVDWDDFNNMVQEQRVSVSRNRKSGDFFKQFVIPLIIIGACVIIGIVMMKYAFDYATMMKGSQAPPQQQEKATAPNIPILSDIIPGQ